MNPLRFTRRRARDVALPLHPSVLKYLLASSVVPSAGFIRALDAFWRRGDRAGWSEALDFFYLFAGPSLAGGLVNLGSAPIPPATAPVAPSFLPYRGIQGDGLGWIRPGFTFPQIPEAAPTNFWIGAYAFDAYSSTLSDFGATGGGATIAIKGANSGRLSTNALCPTFDDTTINSSIGFFAEYRNATESYIVRKRGAESVKATVGAASLPTGEIGLLRLGINGAISPAPRLSAWFGGASAALGASATLRGDMANAFDELMIAIGVLTADDLDDTPETIVPPHAFGPSAMAQVRPGLRVWQGGAPPPTGWTVNTFPRGPLTDTFVTDTALLIGAGLDPSVGRWTRIWGPRANVRAINGGNPISPAITASNGGRCRTEFSSYATADASMIATLAYHLGRAAHETGGTGYLDIINAAGMPDEAWIPYAYAAANPDTVFSLPATNGKSDRVTLDKVIQPHGRHWDIPAASRTGIDFDWEVSDGRSGADATSALLTAAAMCRAAGQQCTLYLNPLNGGNPAQEGIDASNLWQLHAAFDYISVLIYSRSLEGNAADSIRNQLALLTGPNSDKGITYPKIRLTVGIGASAGTLSLTDAATCRQALDGTLPGCPPSVSGSVGSGKAMGGVLFWPNLGTPGGALSRSYNQVIATVLGLPTS